MGLSGPLVVLNDVGISAMLSQLFEPVLTRAKPLDSKQSLTRAKSEGPEPLRRDRQAEDLTAKSCNHAILNQAVSKRGIYAIYQRKSCPLSVSYSFIDTVMFGSTYGSFIC